MLSRELFFIHGVLSPDRSRPNNKWLATSLTICYCQLCSTLNNNSTTDRQIKDRKLQPIVKINIIFERQTHTHKSRQCSLFANEIKGRYGCYTRTCIVCRMGMYSTYYLTLFSVVVCLLTSVCPAKRKTYLQHRETYFDHYLCPGQSRTRINRFA